MKQLKSVDADFLDAAADVFASAIAEAKQAGSDSFSFEFEAPAGVMTVVCLIRPKAVADPMLEGLHQARQAMIDNGDKYDPMSDPEFGRVEPTVATSPAD